MYVVQQAVQHLGDYVKSCCGFVAVF